MKKFIVAGVLILVGVLSVSVVFAADTLGLPMPKEDPVLRTRTISEPFSSVSVSVGDFDVVFDLSEDDTCTITYPEDEDIPVDISVTDDALVIEQHRDALTWYRNLLPSFNRRETVTVRLPDCCYGALSICSGSGNVDVSAACTFACVTVEASSGNVTCQASTEKADISAASGNVFIHIPSAASAASSVRVACTSGNIVLTGDSAVDPSCTVLRAETTSGNVSLRNAKAESASFHTTSGKISLENLSVNKDLNAKTTSGNIRIRNANAESTSFHVTSGDVSLENLFVKGELKAESTSGSIHLTKCDGGSLDIITSSGDVNAILTSPKLFEVHSTSGNIRLPNESYGDPCRVTTASGDISISVE